MPTWSSTREHKGRRRLRQNGSDSRPAMSVTTMLVPIARGRKKVSGISKLLISTD